MVILCVEILGFKSMADYWELKRRKEKHKGISKSNGDGDQLQSTGRSCTERPLQNLTVRSCFVNVDAAL